MFVSASRYVVRSHPHPAPTRPQPAPPHSNPHYPSSHPHLSPSEPYPHSHYSQYGRGSFFGPWFNHYLPSAPPVTAPALPPTHLPPASFNHNHYRFYRRCGRRVRLLPLLIVGGAGYFAYRKLESKIEEVRSEVSNEHHIDTDSTRTMGSSNNLVGVSGLPSMVEENEGGKHWGWHGRRGREREAERRRVEEDRKRSEFETKMKEWEEAVRQEKERKENSRWI